MKPLIVKNLTKKFSDFTAVNNVSFDVNEGEILGLLGPNGAGKTTIITMLLSTLKPTHGEIIYFGKNFFTHRSEILQRVSYASTYVKLPPRLTIYENLDIYGRLYGMSQDDIYNRCKELLIFFGMWDIKNRSMGVLSAGQTTRVMLVKAFLASPKVVLLDEPTASLDPDIALEVRKFIIDQQKKYGVSILITSHNMDEVTEVCDRVLVLKNGTIIAQDTPENLAASIDVAHVRIIIPHDISRAVELIKQQYKYHVEDRVLDIMIDEQEIAQLLMKLAQHSIHYEHISIDKPSLEDYFLRIVKTR